MKRIGVFAIALLAAAAAQDAAARGRTCDAFSELRMTLERNETDGDTEVVLFAKGQDDGLSALWITAPNGRIVAAVLGDRRGIGLREFALESAEPPDLGRVLRSFPEGPYRMRGLSVEGDCLAGSVPLSHLIAPATQLLTPAEDQVVPIDQLVLSWSEVPEAERYIVELQNEELATEFSFQILPPVTSLAIPAAMLVAGSEYQFGVAVQTAEGNVTAVESAFFTEP